ncbi:MAG: Lrp/AsnC family transcriptional regulator, partial [Candidatus Zixiibacteriota bacterium]
RRAMHDYTEITHAYLRDHAWNLWFTVVAENEEAMNAVIKQVTERAELRDVRRLKRNRSFKLKVNFNL